MNTQLAKNLNEILNADLNWKQDDENAEGVVARVYSHADLERYLRDLREDTTIEVSSSKDDDGREWLWVMPRG